MSLRREYDYDKFYRSHCELQRSSKKYILNLVDSGEGHKALDVGCGTGVNSKFLKGSGHDVVGIDLSNVALRAYLDEGFNGLRGDINNNLPFVDSTFNLIFASEVIEHISNTEMFLREAYRVLKPGGIVVLSTPNSSFWVYRIFYSIGKSIAELQHPNHVRFFTKEMLETYIKLAGFKNAMIYGRHMYIIVGDRLGKILDFLFPRLGFEREFRVSSDKHFWHKSTFASKASDLWTDTFIIRAEKAK